MFAPSLDRRILVLMRTRGHHPLAERVAKGLAAAGEWGAVWAASALAAGAMDRRRRRRWIAAAAVAPGAIAVNYAVKVAVRRARPVLGEELPPLGAAISALSFPSAHTTSSFAAAAAMSRIAPEARVPLYAGAAAIAITRPYLGMHYPSDVLAGVVLGTALGRVAPGVDSGADDIVAAQGPA